MTAIPCMARELLFCFLQMKRIAVLVAGGYFICEFFLYGSSAAASIPANIIQGVGGLIISFVLYPVLMAIPDVKQLTYKTK